MFSGCATAIVTPMKDSGEIDEEGLRRIIEFQEENGINSIVPCGSTGESATLSYKEHLKVIEITVDTVKKMKVLAGAGSNSTSEALQLSKAAQDIGADGVLSICPYYNKPTPKGIYLHFEAVASAVDIPVIIYNIPSRTGTNITASQMIELSEISGIAGVKEASGNLSQICRIIAGTSKDFCVLSGDDALTLPAVSVGAKGAISVSSNIVPKRISEMIHTALNGDIKKAAELNAKLIPIYEAMFLETNPIPVKTAMNMMGLPAGALRLPLCRMSTDHEEKLKSALAEQGLL